MKLNCLISVSVLLLSACSGKNEIYNPVFTGTEILTPPPSTSPLINGPLLYGARPGHVFLYRIPCQGARPVEFAVDGLPEGLSLDPVKGIISGVTPAEGEYD